MREPRPAHATVLASYRCVNHCVFCAPRELRDARERPSPDEIRRFIADAGRRRVHNLSISGAGEPCLEPELVSYVEAATQAGIERIHVFTSGYKLDRRLLSRLLDAGVTGFLVSVHGTREVHDHVSGRQGSFRDALAALSLVTAAGIDVTVNSCLTVESTTDLRALVDLVARYAPTNHTLTFPEHSGAALRHRELLLTYEAFRLCVESLGTDVPPWVRVDNVPSCLAPRNAPLITQGGEILYKDTNTEGLKSLEDNLGNNTYLPACREAPCALLGVCRGLDRRIIERADRLPSVTPLVRPRP